MQKSRGRSTKMVPGYLEKGPGGEARWRCKGGLTLENKPELDVLEPVLVPGSQRPSTIASK